MISLAGTSRRLRHLYSDNAKPIYAAVGPRSFVFEQRARQLVVDGGGPALEESMSLFYLASMGRNWQIIKKAMDEFEVQMKENIKSKLFPSKYLSFKRNSSPRLEIWTHRSSRTHSTANSPSYSERKAPLCTVLLLSLVIDADCTRILGCSFEVIVL